MVLRSFKKWRKKFKTKAFLNSEAARKKIQEYFRGIQQEQPCYAFKTDKCRAVQQVKDMGYYLSLLDSLKEERKYRGIFDESATEVSQNLYDTSLDLSNSIEGMVLMELENLEISCKTLKKEEVLDKMGMHLTNNPGFSYN